MSSFLSTISGSFSKSLLIGMFAPAALFVIVSLLLINPLLPGIPVLNPVTAIDNGWTLVAITLITIILSLVLYSLNGTIIRFYEGYPWANLRLGRARQRHYQRLSGQYEARWAQLRSLINWMDRVIEKQSSKDEAERQAAEGVIKAVANNWLATTAPKEVREHAETLQGRKRIDFVWNSLYSQVDSEYSKADYRRTAFPSRESLILPTRLGNAIRKYEEYPALEYGIDAVALWPRLVAVIEPTFASALDDSKSGLDFLLNCSVLSWLLAVVILCVGIFSPLWAASALVQVRWVSSLLLLFIGGYLCYVGSIFQAAQWGHLFSSAFDIYRGDMLNKMGFQREFKNRAEEKQFWQPISQRVIYRWSPTFPDYKEKDDSPLSPAVGAECASLHIQLPYQRTAARQLFSRRIRVEVKIHNETDQTIPDLIFHDILPGCSAYIPNSARGSQGHLSLANTQPFSISVSQLALAPQRSLKITYLVEEKTNL